MEVAASLLAFLSASFLYFSAAAANTNCSLLDNDDFSEDRELLQLADGPSGRTGYYAYRLPNHCEGIVTSIRARGYCPNAADGNTVVLPVINSTLVKDTLAVHYTNLTAECNTSYEIVPSYYEGYVSADNLSISIKFNTSTHLSIIFSPECSRGQCFFQPAIVNNTSSHELFFYSDDLRSSELIHDKSLLFQAIISHKIFEQDENVPESELNIIGTVSWVILLPCFALVFIILLWISKRKRDQLTTNTTFMKADYTCKKDCVNEEKSDAKVAATSTETRLGLSQISLSPDKDIVINIELKDKAMFFSRSQIDLGKVIGQGESGLVYNGFINMPSCRKMIAIKTLKALPKEGDKERLMKEVTIMINFHHPNVMPLIGLCFDRDIPFIIMPFMSKGNVLEYVRGNRETLYVVEEKQNASVEAARKTCLGICHQISKGMSYLASVRYIHRDLAAKNCMIDYNGVIKVSDFGLTEDMYSTIDCDQNSTETGREERMPMRWMAPESIESNVFSEKTDVWSFGVTCWEVFTSGGVPYAGISVTALLCQLHSGHRLDRPSNTACSDDIWRVIVKCWLLSPIERPTFAELVNSFTDLLDTDPAYIKIIKD